jgi:hypothetical protein
MNRLNRWNCLVCVTSHPLALIIGAGAVAWFALLVAAPARGDWYWWPYQKAPAAFSLKINVTNYEQNAGGDLMQAETRAQRSDAATVIVDTMYLPRVPRTIRVIRLPDGTWIRLVDAASAKSTCRPKHLEVAPARETLFSAPKPPNCLGPLDKLLGQTVLFGQPVDVVKTWDRGSAGERWLAPALGCLELQWQNADLQPDGSRRIRLDGKLVSFTLGEPDPRLFDSGGSYAEVKPSELLRREMKAAGVRWSPELAEASEREDQHFAVVCQVPATPPQ